MKWIVNNENETVIGAPNYDIQGNLPGLNRFI
jgi:hypothetical protein